MHLVQRRLRTGQPAPDAISWTLGVSSLVWQIVRDDGVTELDTRYILRTDGGELIDVRNAGIRDATPETVAKLLAGEAVDPALVYLRTVPRFETSAAGLQWLARAIFIGAGERHPDLVVIRVWKVE